MGLRARVEKVCVEVQRWHRKRGTQRQRRVEGVK